MRALDNLRDVDFKLFKIDFPRLAKENCLAEEAFANELSELSLKVVIHYEL